MRSFPKAAIVLVFCSLVSATGWAQHLHCNPCRHGFGQVQVGKSESYSFVLTNTGTKNLTVSSKSMKGPGFSFGSVQLPAKLRPGASLQLPVIFSPTQKGQVSGTAKVTSTDPKSPLTLQLGGTGSLSSEAELDVTPATLNFGSVTVGTTASLKATLTASNGDVTISSDQTNSSEFVITGINFPVKVANGKSLKVSIQFTPNQSGKATAQAGFFSDAVNSPTIEQLTGKGIAQSQHEADLTWDSGDPNAVGYNIYRSGVHGGPYSQINSSLDSATSYTDYNVVGGSTYYYVATEVNNQGQESSYSNETSVTIPNN